jgi:hypothetical protein
MDDSAADEGRCDPLSSIPDSNLPTWVIGWRGRIMRDVGTDYVVAEHSERAVREYEREHPTRQVVNVYPRAPLPAVPHKRILRIKGAVKTQASYPALHGRLRLVLNPITFAYVHSAPPFSRASRI